MKDKSWGGRREGRGESGKIQTPEAVAQPDNNVTPMEVIYGRSICQSLKWSLFNLKSLRAKVSLCWLRHWPPPPNTGGNTIAKEKRVKWKRSGSSPHQGRTPESQFILKPLTSHKQWKVKIILLGCSVSPGTVVNTFFTIPITTSGFFGVLFCFVF